MDLGLKGRKALVAGGGRGIGKAIAFELAREGADVAIVSRTRGELDATAQEIATATGQKVVPLMFDVTSRDQVDKGVSEAAQKLRGLDILVNSASLPGGSPTAIGPIETVDDADLIKDFDTKYVGALRCARAAIPFLKEAGWGRIINISGGNARAAGNLSGGARNVSMVHLTKTSIQPPWPARYNSQLYPSRDHPNRADAGNVGRESSGRRCGCGRSGTPGLCPRFPQRQRHLPHGGRLGGGIPRRIPGLRQGMGRYR